MPAKDSLTNEPFITHFSSQFTMVNTAIRLAGEIVRSGRAEIEEENPVALVLEELVAAAPVVEPTPPNRL